MSRRSSLAARRDQLAVGDIVEAIGREECGGAPQP